jgi:hypothetical protein
LYLTVLSLEEEEEEEEEETAALCLLANLMSVSVGHRDGDMIYQLIG